MPLTSRLSQAVALVQAFETFQARAVRNDGRGWTIGYGHTASAREGAAVDRAEAAALLLYDLSQVAAVLDAVAYSPLNDNQRQALCAFGFNIGVENLKRSTALRRLNAGDYLGAAREIERWRRAEIAGEGQVVDLLVRRRAAEKSLFLTPPEGFPKTTGPLLQPQFDGAAEPGPPLYDMESQEPRPAQGAPSDSCAAMVAAQGVSDRLRTLVPEPEPPPETPVKPDLPTSAAQATIPKEDPPAPAVPIEAPPPPRSVPPPPPLRTVPPALDETTPPPPVVDLTRSEPPPPPRSAPRAVAAPMRLAPETLALHGETLAAVSETPPPSPSPARESATSPLSQAPAAIGLVGMLLFLGSALSIIAGRPGAVNLAFGLAGAICLGLALFWRLGRRKRSSDG